MRNYSPDKIRSYAQRQVDHVEQQRFAVPIIGLLVMALPASAIYMLKEKSNELGVFLPLDKHFLLGFTFGVLFMLLALIGGLCLVGLMSRFRGMEYHVQKRLLELEGNNREGNTPENTP